MRGQDGLALQNAAQGMNRILASAQLNGYQWVFIDTAPTTWVVVQEAIRAATLVLIPVRPGFFDLAAVRETVATARDLGKPYAVVINAAPVKREEKEAPAVALSRAQFDALAIPVWSGQISQRAGLPRLARGRRQRRRDRRRFRLQDRDRAAVVGGRTLGRGDQPRPCRRRRVPGGITDAGPARASKVLNPRQRSRHLVVRRSIAGKLPP